jgi:cyclase
VRKHCRIIPRLDIKGPNVVKGVHLEGLRVVGKPELFASRYYEDGADELIYIDTVASLYGRNNLEEIVRRTAERIFIPMTVGGGIRSVKDMERILRSGADKVAVNTAAVSNPALISEGARVFGSQCIVLSIQAKRRSSGMYECLTDNAREETGIDAYEWVKKAVDLGAGEILLTSVDMEGTGAGYDIELTRTVATMVGVPVIASGGAGLASHIRDVVGRGMADAVSAASIFHYGLADYMAATDDYEEEGNIEFLKKRLPLLKQERKGIVPTTIKTLKKYLSGAGIPCRV